MATASWIDPYGNSLYIDPIEIVRLDQLDTIIRKINPRFRLRGQCWKAIAQRPSTDGRVHLHARVMRQLYQTRPGLASGAGLFLWRTLGVIPRAELLGSLGRIPILFAEQND